ncbi:MAG: sodium-translocating pyrophosphatase [Verrucomicrobia bacterium]|nr:sodium-translocating pyrophosphatase [Verrucomicrobiota bacterium]
MFLTHNNPFSKVSFKTWLLPLLPALVPSWVMAGESDLLLPKTDDVVFHVCGMTLTGGAILWAGIIICLGGMAFGLGMYKKLTALPSHPSMLDMSKLIYGTCRTYLIQQGKLLIILELIIGAAMAYYFGYLKQMTPPTVALILGWSVIGILGSYSVAWFGMLINNVANSRMAFAALRARPIDLSEIPTSSGMSIGVLLVSVELIVMICVLKFVDPAYAGSCFIGFAIGESLGASVLRICGGIFTKIADIGSDMMKIVFKIKEDDARNPGVIADCTGDNAGDSVGPTADGFETYGVTGVALITFICLAVQPTFQGPLIVWMFAMRIVMVLTSIISWKINSMITRSVWGGHEKFNFEHPLTLLVWLTSILSIIVTFVLSYQMLHAEFGNLWWKLGIIISCGTLAAAVIPELTRIFTSMKSAHCREIVNATREGGTGLTILSGLIAGNFSAFWKGLTIVALMLIALVTSSADLSAFMQYPSVFAFGLVAFGMLGMGPVTIAVDSYGPVTDNAQSIFELSTIEQVPNAAAQIEKDFGFKPDFHKAKLFLEDNDGAGNTFKATAKPMLIGTAVVGATTMIFSLILLLKEHFHWTEFARLSIVEAPVLLGLITGGAVIYWFCGASMQAVTTGAYRAVAYIKKNIRLNETEKASEKDTNEVVRICTQYAQFGMINIFVVIFSLTLAFACLNEIFFVAYLISIAIFGLFAAIMMANAGGCWDNAKKIVEVELREKGTDMHASTVIGDLVGDPFKDTTAVALNPIIKFTTLFGLLAVEIAINSPSQARCTLGIILLLVGLVFVWRSFHCMRIPAKEG